MTNQNTTAVATRGQTAPSTDVVPDGYQPLELQPPGRLPTKDEYSMMMMIASMAVEGANKATKAEDRAIPANLKTPEQAMTVMLAGYELGMPPFTALRRVFIVKGRTELETQALMGLVKAGDPTARFKFHEYSSDVVDVELFRGGESMIRCAYTREDAQRSGQLKEKWYRKKDFNADGQPYFMVPADTRLEPGDRLGAAVPRTNPTLHYVLEMAGSAWTSYTRDMLAYNAVKRCCRLGAPELTNQIGALGRGDLAPPPYRVAIEERAVGDEQGALSSPLQRALVEGKVSPAEIAAEAAVDDEERAQAEPEPPADPSAPITPALFTSIVAALKDMMATWPPSDYGKFYRGLQAKYFPGDTRKLDEQMKGMTLVAATAMREEIAQARGEPPAAAALDREWPSIAAENEEAGYGPEDEEESETEAVQESAHNMTETTEPEDPK